MYPNVAVRYGYGKYGDKTLTTEDKVSCSKTNVPGVSKKSIRS